MFPQKGGLKVPASKFFITKPLVRYDYTILKQLVDELGIDDVQSRDKEMEKALEAPLDDFIPEPTYDPKPEPSILTQQKPEVKQEPPKQQETKPNPQTMVKDIVNNLGNKAQP
jgi:hypothetical protein